jgi:hypothetical protein
MRETRQDETVRRSGIVTRGVCCLGLLVATACEPAAESPPATVDPQEVFWTALTALCGQAFEGSVQDPQPQDTAFAGRTLVMHVRECAQDEIRIPFHVDDDRSRTWVLTRTGPCWRMRHTSLRRAETDDGSGGRDSAV